MRPLTVLYVENDQALLGLLGGQLANDSRIAKLIRATDSSQALEVAKTQAIDVALLDISLGVSSMNGVELAKALRQAQENCGIVLLSQNITADVMNSAPEHFRYGWSAIQKTADLDLNYLIDVLQSTARGLNIVDPSEHVSKVNRSLSQLSQKQRTIMDIAATGVEATEIANQLGLAPVTIRQELSRIYKILVPAPKHGTDLRTTAVLNYLRLNRDQPE